MQALVNSVQANPKNTKVPYTKPSLSIQDQVAQLQARGLIITDINKVTDLLAHVNYFRLEAYWYTYYDNSLTGHFFVKSITFELIWSHYCFDRRLRAHISHALERIEVSFRTQFAFNLSQTFGPFPLNLNTLNFSQREWNSNLLDLQKTCQDSKELFATHFYAKYSNDLLPIWALVEIQSFGQVVFYYKKIKSLNIKSHIGSVFGLNPRELASWLHHLSYIRNICAHHSRLWNKRFTILPMPPQRTISQDFNSRWIFAPYTHTGDDPYNERRLFNTILIIDYLLSKICSDNIWKTELLALMKNYSIDASRMGFSNGWESDSFWQ
jgi:abortive infection bacteriophage resistance protein